MIKIKSFFSSSLCIFLSFFSQNSLSQGCSDAGFCTISGVKPSLHFFKSVPKHQVKIGAFLGKSDHNISVWGNYLQYSYQFDTQWSGDVKITSLAQHDSKINTFGLGDVFLSANYRVSNPMQFTFGVKIPLNSANKTQNSIPLPMHYQSSLGTFDIIAAIGYTLKNFQFHLAYQQPISQNKNTYLNTSDTIFQSTNAFKRSSDLLIRVSYPFNISEKVTLTPSILPIYHLTNDRYTDILGKQQTIKNSKGLTLNTAVFADYRINKTHKIQCNIGLPILTRKVRPDGLTRSFLGTLEYAISF